MKNALTTKHEFALYVADLSQRINKSSLDTYLTLDIPELVHRLQHVLRLQLDQSIILFNREFHGQFIIKSYIKNKAVSGIIESYEANCILQPSLLFLLPLLKKEAFEQALYNIVELGVSTIQPIITEKSHRTH